MDRQPANLWRRGKQTPAFAGRTDVNPKFNFDSVAGRCVVLMFYGSIELQASRESLQEIYTTLRSRFDDKQALFFGVCVDPRDPERGVRDAIPGIRLFWDFDLRISKLFAAVSAAGESIADGPLAFRSFSLVLDHRLRVYDYIPIESAQQHTAQLQESLDGLIAEEAARRQSMHAPVLIVPNVLPRHFCERLIDIYQQQGGKPSGTMTTRDGKTVGKMDRSFKRRLDAYITDPGVIRDYQSYLIDNLFPQIRAAFQFHPAHIERYIIACYDGDDQGFFRPHRDNTTPGTAHRRFACTINLNADHYSGGDLRFPEYGDATYRAPTGGVVVFSGSILHEALPVTSGQRYATLPFIHDAAAELIRKQNMSSISSEIIDVDRPLQAATQQG